MPKPHSVPVATFMRVNFLVFFAKKSGALEEEVDNTCLLSK